MLLIVRRTAVGTGTFTPASTCYFSPIFSGFYRDYSLVYTNKMRANDRDALRPYCVRENMAPHMCPASNHHDDVVEKSRCVARNILC
jgi:hypothetical protein